MRVVHIACISLNTHTGMGRIATKWKLAFEQAGHEFIHIGSDEVKAPHIFLWGSWAFHYCKRNHISADVWLVHEPFGGSFVNEKGSLVVFSHGIEERCWLLNRIYKFEKRSLKASLIPIFLRFRSQRIGFKHARLCLLSNKTDAAFLLNRKINPKNIYVFHNGYSFANRSQSFVKDNLTIIVNGSWIKRKGVDIIALAMSKILKKYPHVNLVLAGTGTKEFDVLKEFDNSVYDQIQIVPSFNEVDEEKILAGANIFLLASFYEGQSVALTQAMAASLCPVVSDNSGQLDFIENGVDGLVFKTGDVGDLIEKLELLISEQYLITVYGERAAQKVKGFTWSAVTDDLIKKIQSISD
jgi:glycosyltransferase involved in cell wall biosynthesis